MSLKKIFFIVLMSMLLIMNCSPRVHAALQANGNDGTNKNRNAWMQEIRQMESLGGTLGLTETQEADLTANSDSNNIDIHMQKNTEYGAMALLSASAYGNPTNISLSSGDTTTGNVTGVVTTNNYEWVAAHYGNIRITYPYGAAAEAVPGPLSYNSKYYNYYLSDSASFKGDALYETQGWQNSSADVGQSGQPRTRNVSSTVRNIWLFNKFLLEIKYWKLWLGLENESNSLHRQWTYM